MSKTGFEGRRRWFQGFFFVVFVFCFVLFVCLFCFVFFFFFLGGGGGLIAVLS